MTCRWAKYEILWKYSEKPVPQVKNKLSNVELSVELPKLQLTFTLSSGLNGLASRCEWKHLSPSQAWTHLNKIKHTHNTIVKCSYLCNLHFTTPFKHKRKVYHLNILVKYIVLKRHQVFHCDVVPISNIEDLFYQKISIEYLLYI